MLTAEQLVESARRPGFFGLVGKSIEKRAQKDFRAYFQLLGEKIAGLGLEKYASLDPEHARSAVMLATSNVLRTTTPMLKLMLKTNIEHAINLSAPSASALAESFQEYSDDEPRDENGRWTINGVSGSMSFSHQFNGEHHGTTAFFRHAGGTEDVGAMFSKDNGDKTASVHEVEVSPEYRGHGIGPALYKAHFKHLKAQGIAKLSSEGKGRNIHSSKVWSKLHGQGLPVQKIGSTWWAKLDKLKESFQEADSDPSRKELDQLGVTGEAAGEYAEARSAQQVQGINATTLRDLQDAIAQGITDRAGVDGLSRIIRSTLTDFEKFRADVIATTEMNDAMSHATLTKLQVLGIENTVWLVTDDERLCPICSVNADVVVKTGEPFPSGDLRPPAHPNCRCAISGSRADAEESFQEYSDNEPRDDQGQWTDGGGAISIDKVNPYPKGNKVSPKDLIADVLAKQPGAKLISKDFGGGYKADGVVLQQDMKFYHGGPEKLDMLRPVHAPVVKAKVKVLNLGGKAAAEGVFGSKYVHEVILPKGTEVFQGMDGTNHVIVTGSYKPSKVYENENQDND